MENIDYSKSSGEECRNVLFTLALEGETVSPEEALSMYANKNNWEQVYANGTMYWAWKGPVICAYELAEDSLKHANQKRE